MAKATVGSIDQALDEGFAPTESRYRISAISRAISMLRAFRPEAPKRTAREIASELGLRPVHVARALDTLEKYNLVRRVSDGYELGFAWLHLADVQRRQFSIRHVALPVMRRLSAITDETVILAVRSGTKRVNVDYIESTHLMRRVTQPGLELPLHTGAAGRVLMSGLSRDEIDHYFSSAAHVGEPIGGMVLRSNLVDEIERTRERGYAVVIAEVTNDTAAIAAPVRDYRGEITAALAVSIPIDRFDSNVKESCVANVIRSSRELSQLLGYAASDGGGRA